MPVFKFIEMLRKKCHKKSTTNTFADRVNKRGPWGEEALFPLVEAFRDGITVSALQIASDVLYNQRPLGLIRVKKDTEEELLKTICNKVLLTSPKNKIPLNRAPYTAPRTLDFGEHMKKLDSYDSWCEMQKIMMTSTGKTQNRQTADIDPWVHLSQKKRQAAIM